VNGPIQHGGTTARAGMVLYDANVSDDALAQKLRYERRCGFCGVLLLGLSETDLRERSVAHVQAEHAEVVT
jgi:hypothetical protein